MSSPSIPRRGQPSTGNTTQPRYYSKQTNLQRRESVQDSLPPVSSHENRDSSETAYSDERCITNAIRVATSTEGNPSQDSTFQMDPILENGQAANMAMFLPLESSQDCPVFTQRQTSGMQKQLLGGAWRGQVLSDQGPPYRAEQRSSTLSSEKRSGEEAVHPQHSKAASIDTCATHFPRPHWPRHATPVAVSLVQPRFPPPERSPTPPGLPSFNTPEAITFAARFNAENGALRPTAANSRFTGSTRGYTLTSYGAGIRRFFVRASLPNTGLSSQAGYQGISRAPGATIVQGRFPIRHSGHGIHHIQDIQEHQFHLPDMPVAETTTAALEGLHEVDEPSVKRPSAPRKRRNSALGSLYTFSRPWTSRDARTVAHAGNASRPDFSEVARSMPSPLQLPAPSIPIHIRPGTDDSTAEPLETQSGSILDKLCCLPMELCKCFCVGDTNAHGPTEPLQTVTSNDTYHTAPSPPSSTRNSTTHGAHDVESNDAQNSSQPPAARRNPFWQRALGFRFASLNI
ncbi:hypothetical protein N7468_007013 [Penicillium chermesinum]|uniref:Uncharacterized protein n=1 Tax=Penicillium chermesinum TaxID=63820 RepID=A0A9W9NVP1_9EURO|nr:uncharacterized protein N7468_007013 [Penicillium chermesinum]KAJ5225788.1 hypothetical protein N7468_007013 [Penicillium chermesinum]KAJ6161002.1 hypothetical protein N7470_004398 [Penicillium chermesinum]